MGDIEDEDEEIEPKFEKIDDNTFLIDGQYYIDDLNDKLLLNLESDEHETIGGLLIDLLGEIPGEDETDRIIELDNLTFKIECVKDRRIDKVKLHVAPISEGKESGEE
jgi:putative hemolysin